MGFRPIGSEPALTLQVRAPVPPKACTVWLYAEATVPFGSGGRVVIFGGAGRTIVMERACSSNWFRVSVARTVKLNGLPTVVVGVPVIWPVEGLMGFRPVGSELGGLTLQVRAPVPPVACTVRL